MAKQPSNSIIEIDPVITEQWNDGYKLEVDLTAETDAIFWQINFKLPRNNWIRETYGVDITENEDGSYSIKGQNDQINLKEGQSIKPVFIVDGMTTQDTLLKFIGSNVGTVVETEETDIDDSESESVDMGESEAMEDLASEFTTSSSIVEDWNGGYKLVLDLTAESKAEDWELDFKLPYKIRDAYGVELQDNGSGNYTISGQNGQIDLKQGQTIKPVFIIDTDNNEQEPLPLEFATEATASDESESMEMAESETMDTEEPETMGMAESETMEDMAGKFTTSSSIVEDWNGGYKLVLDLTAESKAEDWELDFKLPYKIRDAYGVELQDNGSGNYTIKGQNDRAILEEGESIKPVFIIDDNGQEALPLEFGTTVAVDAPEPVDLSQPEPESNPDSESTPSSNSRVASETPAVPTVQQGKFAYGEALQLNFLFYEANRSGDLPPENRLEWRSDSTLNDGSDVGRDLEGGYFDAGDHIKFIQPMAFNNTMLAWGGIDYQEAYKKSGQFDELLDAVKWGTDWFLKAHETDDNGETSRLWVQVGDKTDHYQWVPPEKIDQVTDRQSYSIDRERPGSDAAAGTASALASAAMLFRGTDDAYADELLKNAVALYDFAETYKAKYSDSVPQASPFYESWSGYWDELTLGAAWLYKATGEQKYLNKAENYFKEKVGFLGDWTYAADDHSYGAAMILAQESDDPFFKGQVKNWINTWERGKGGINDTPAGFAHRTAWASIPIDMSTAFAAEWYNDHIEADDSFSFFAMDQVNYVLGDNPRDYSYLIGFGDDFPIRPHHRGSAGSVPLNNSDEPNDHILHGAIVGGLKEANDYSHYDRRDDWVTNEVGIGYNAPFASAVIQQYENLGGDALSEAELDQLVGVDANGVGV